MAEEPEAPARPTTLGDALGEYLRSLKPDLRRAQEPYLRKYVEYQSESFLVGDLKGSRVESYALDTIRGSDPNAPDRVTALKAWFQYLKKKNYTSENFGVHVRVPKAPGRPAGARQVRVEEAPLEMTSEGIVNLQHELAELEERKLDTIRAIEVARQDGDLRENAPYHAAREQLSFTQQRMTQIENALKRAIAVDKSEDDRSAVGSRVTVTRLDKGTQDTYQLVGAREANARERRISVESPVGRELLGKRVGDQVSVETPSGSITYRIETIEA